MSTSVTWSPHDRVQVQTQQHPENPLPQIAGDPLGHCDRFDRRGTKHIHDPQRPAELWVVPDLDREHLGVDRRAGYLPALHHPDRLLVEPGLDDLAKESCGLAEGDEVISSDPIP